MNVTLNELGLVKYSISLSSTDVAYKCIHAIGAAMSLLASWLLKIMSRTQGTSVADVGTHVPIWD